MLINQVPSAITIVAADCTGLLSYEQLIDAAFKLLQDETRPTTRVK